MAIGGAGNAVGCASGTGETATVPLAVAGGVSVVAIGGAGNAACCASDTGGTTTAAIAGDVGEGDSLGPALRIVGACCISSGGSAASTVRDSDGAALWSTFVEAAMSAGEATGRLSAFDCASEGEACVNSASGTRPLWITGLSNFSATPPIQMMPRNGPANQTKFQKNKDFSSSLGLGCDSRLETCCSMLAHKSTFSALSLRDCARRPPKSIFNWVTSFSVLRCAKLACQ